MQKWVEASSGNKLVIRISDGIYAMSGRGSCIFAEDPDSFYKFGYFDVNPESVKAGAIKEALSDLRGAAESLNEKTAYKFLIPPLSIKVVKKAVDEFLEKIEHR